MIRQKYWRGAALATLVLCSATVGAAVNFTPWTKAGVRALAGSVAEREGLVMVVITQPDWCPACIQLDRELLANQQAIAIADLTADWVVLEVLGYDSEGAAFLAAEGLKFVGTPTTLLIRPGRDDGRLADGALLASVAGYPDDYLQRLERAAAGYDEVREAQAAARADGSVDAFETLADAYVEHGDSASAERVYLTLLARQDLDEERRADLRWALITNVYQRVDKDHARTLTELARYARDYPDTTTEEAFTYATVWSLLSVGRTDDARRILRENYLAVDDPDRLAAYLYLAFRHPSADLLVEAEAAARKGLAQYPDQQARLTAGLGRILRRRGCLGEAADAFREAVKLAGPGHESYTTYVGQLDYVEIELAAGGATQCRAGATRQG